MKVTEPWLALWLCAVLCAVSTRWMWIVFNIDQTWLTRTLREKRCISLRESFIPVTSWILILLALAIINNSSAFVFQMGTYTTSNTHTHATIWFVFEKTEFCPFYLTSLCCTDGGLFLYINVFFWLCSFVCSFVCLFMWMAKTVWWYVNIKQSSIFHWLISQMEFGVHLAASEVDV